MKNVIVLLMLVLMISSCRKDSDVIEWDQETKVTVDGFVTGDNDKVLSDVSVTIGGRSTTTDQYGYFKLEDAIGKNEKIYVKASKIGFFPGSRVEFIKATDKKHIRIKMLPMKFEHNFNSSDGATITVDDKVKLVFPAQAIKHEKGNVYNGEVKVAVKYIDPTTSDGQNEMPGNLVGRNTNNEEQSLASYAMVAVELRSPTGEELNIVDGKKVLMEVDIPQSIRNNAPQNIPLWHFDEENGIWVEEGNATKVGNKYEGEVSHFSFWNWDIPYQHVFINGKVLYNSNPLDVKIKLSLSSSTSRVAFTNEDGIFEAPIPKGEVLKLEVIDFCNNILYMTEIGPFVQNEIIQDILLNGATPFSKKDLNITVIDCNNNPIKYAAIEVENKFALHYTNENGNLIYRQSSCIKNSLNLRAIDIENSLQSDYITILSTSPDNIVIQICSTPFALDHFINFKISNGEEFTLVGHITENDSISGIGWEAAMLGKPEGNSGLGWIFHKNRILGQNISLPYIGNVGKMNNIPYEYKNVVYNDNDYIYYTKLANADGEFTEGTFRIEGVNKLVENVLIETDLTIEGSFKTPYFK